MEKRDKKINYISIIAVCAAILLAACGLFGGGRSDVAILDYDLAESGIKIRVGLMSSAGYIRRMKVEEEGKDVLAEFYSTWGINNPNGAKNEFIIEAGQNCERILFRRGKNIFRPVLERNGDGEWVRSVELQTME